MNDLKFVIGVLEYLIREANGWHDECRGKLIDSPEMDEAINLLEMFQSLEEPVEKPKRAILTLATSRALDEHRH